MNISRRNFTQAFRSTASLKRVSRHNPWSGLSWTMFYTHEILSGICKTSSTHSSSEAPRHCLGGSHASPQRIMLTSRNTTAGSISLACWLFVLAPQLFENYMSRSADGISLAFLIVWSVIFSKKMSFRFVSYSELRESSQGRDLLIPVLRSIIHKRLYILTAKFSKVYR